MFGSNFTDYLSLMGVWGTGTVILVLTIVFAVLAIAGGVVLSLTVFSKKNEGKFNGFLGWAYNFVNFKKFYIEPVLKITYVAAAIYVTLSAFMNFLLYGFGAGIFMFLIQIIFGNIVLRLIYEAALLLVKVVKNLNEINKKMSGEAAGANEMFSDLGIKTASAPAAQVPQYQPVSQATPTAYTAPAPAPQPVQPVSAVPQPVQPTVQAQPVPVPQPVPAPVQPEPPVQQAEQPQPDKPITLEKQQSVPAPAESASETVFCSVCSKQIKPTSRFCPYCGSPRS